MKKALIFIFFFSQNSLFSQKKVTLEDLKHIAKDFHHQNISSYYKYNDLFYQNRKLDFDLNTTHSVLKIEEYFLTGIGDTIDYSFRFFNEFGDLDSIIRQKGALKFFYDENQILLKLISEGKNGTETIRLNDSTFLRKAFSSLVYRGEDSYIQYEDGLERHYSQNQNSKRFTLEVEFKNNKVFRFSDKELDHGNIFTVYNKKGSMEKRFLLLNLKTDTAFQTKWLYTKEGFVEREIQTSFNKRRNKDTQFQYSILDLENGNKALKQQKIIDDKKGETVVYDLDKNLNWTAKETIQINGIVAMKKIRKITYRE